MKSLLILIFILGFLTLIIYEYTKIKFYYNNKKSEEQLEKTLKMVNIDYDLDYDKEINLDSNNYQLVDIMINKKRIVFRTDNIYKKNDKLKLFYKEEVVQGIVVKGTYKKDKINFKTKPRKLKLYQERGKHENK